MTDKLLYKEPSTTLNELTRKDGADAAWAYLNCPRKDGLEPARGIVNGVLISSFFWIGVIVLIAIMGE